MVRIKLMQSGLFKLLKLNHLVLFGWVIRFTTLKVNLNRASTLDVVMIKVMKLMFFKISAVKVFLGVFD